MENKTEKILQQIKSKKVESVLYNEEYFLKVEPLHLVIQKRIAKLNIKQIDLITKIDLDKQNGYKYLNGSKKIKRNLILKILISLDYNFEEIQEILKTYQYPTLYPKLKRDHIIISAIINNKNVEEINNVLALNNEYLL